MAMSIEERRTRKREAMRRWRAEHPNEARALMAAWYAAHPGYERQKSQQWRDANPERSRELALLSYYRNYAKRKALREQRRDLLRERAKAWRLAHLEQDAAKSRRRFARKRGAAGSHTLAQFRALCEQNGWLCTYCSCLLTTRTVTEDHMVPITRGGSDDISNITLACTSCNSRKYTRTYDEFMSQEVA